MKKFRGSSDYVASNELMNAVNVAIALEKPLLIKGEPGTGKTMLAQSIAEALDMPLIIWGIKSTTKAQEGLYMYDTVQRLYDSQFGEGDVSDIKQYIKLGKLGKVPTFKDFSDVLGKYQDGYIRPMAQRIRTALEIFTEGSMSIFAHETNVDLHKPIIDIDLRDLTDEHRKMGMATTLDLIWNRLTLNQSQNKRTWIFVEEYQSLMTDRYTSEFFRSVWSRARKYGGRPFAITQNVDLLLKSADSSTMIANSEFVIALNQSGRDVYQMQNLLRLSNDQTDYLQNALPGHGLIRYGSSIIPFNAEWPSDSNIYRLITTKPGEMLQYNGAESMESAEIPNPVEVTDAEEASGNNE